MKKMDRRLTSGIALAAMATACFSTAVMAERGPADAEGRADRGAPMIMQKFDAIDADKDGKVTPAEIEAFRAARFAEADLNKDGTLDAAELSALRLAQMQARAEADAARMIERMDDSGDGKLAADEMPGMDAGQRLFDRVDADKDGAVSKDEVDQMMARMEGRGNDRDHDRGHDRGRGKDRDGNGGPGWWWPMQGSAN